jgi:hypothetical protein
MAAKRLRVGILDLVTKAPTKALWARVMHPNLASIMPQALAVWCERAGHDVTFVCFTGNEDLLAELPKDMDILFIGAFTQAGQISYALSNMFRKRGVVTVLGGPHARCYPEDARKYFDYVVGFTDETVIEEILSEVAPHRPYGRYLAASRQPRDLPSVRERWKFIEPTIEKSPTRLKAVPMIGSLGCPYTCSFCIDSAVPYQPMDLDQIRDDLRFLAEKRPGIWVGWHDPNFGVKFDDYLSTIEEAIPPGTISFAAESSLSLLSEANVKRMAAAGFKVMLPGVESWNSLGNKSRTGAKTGLDKVRQVSEHVNMILRYLPYVQANFVLGLDCDVGDEAFELTKRFIDMTPGAFPGYSLLSAFGEAAPLNLEFQRDGRVLPFPFHFLNNNQAMNVVPANYSWKAFYDHVIDLTQYSFSWRNIRRRAFATPAVFARFMNVVRAVSTEGFGRIKYYTNMRHMLDHDRSIQAFFSGESAEIPSFYINRVRSELGPLWEELPKGALHHDPNAYLKKFEASAQEQMPTVIAGRKG